LDNGIDISLAARLENIYAWTIDFFYLQKGDYFKVVYEEEFVEGESIGISRIKGATFSHGGKDFHALYFDQEGKPDYFDEAGNSLRKAFLKAPLQYSRISSRFSNSRFHPVLKRYKAHLGVDYAAPHGTPIMAVGDGIVQEATRRGGNGNFVKIKHNSMFATQYLHMSGFAKGIRPGVAVRQGEVIGYVGSTGLATGPHVCFRFWKNGQQVNPLAIEMPPSEPILDTLREQFQLAWDSMAGRLSGIPLVEEAPVLAISDEEVSVQPVGGP
jgi:murein DD-endopeptidase MepM/ murein hydrolase activator NlpD